MFTIISYFLTKVIHGYYMLLKILIWFTVLLLNIGLSKQLYFIITQAFYPITLQHIN